MDTPGTEKIAPPQRQSRRGVWLPAIAVLAVAGSIFALTTLRTDQQETADPALAAQSVVLPASVVNAQKAALAGYSPAAEATPSKAIAVDIKNYAYAPSNLTVSVGDTVIWTNQDTAPHTVTVTNGPEMFNSPTLQQGQTFTFTFTKPGTYSYYCAVHPDMKASLTVQGSTPPPTTTTTPAPTTTDTTTTTMPMPTTTGPSSGCAIKEALAPFIAHLKAAHLEESLGQQVTDLLNLDQYIKTHTVLIENMLTPILNGDATQTVKDVLTPFLVHLKAAHLDEGLGQQVGDLLNVNQYVKTHTVLVENMLTPVFNQLTC